MLNILLSSLLFSVTFFVPSLSLCTMTTFLIPLYRLQRKKLFIHGITWGLIVFGCYWYWILILFENQTKYCVSIIFWIIATLWCSLFSGIWIYLFNYLPIITTTLFFIWTQKAILFLLGSIEGIPFINPLVLLSEYQLILKLLHYMPEQGILTALFGIQYIVCKQKNNIQAAYVITLALVSIYHIATHTDQKHPEQNITIITPWWYNQKKGAMFDGYRLAYEISKACNPKKTECIITPESTFCFDVQEFENFIEIWSESGNQVPILLGAHLKRGGFPHNATLLLHNSKIKRIYFKQHQMPLVEKTIWFEYLLRQPLLSGVIIKDGNNQERQNDLFCINKKIYQLYMCSELFMEVKRNWGYPILFLWNDTWLSCDYMKRLARNFILYFEAKYKIKVYYLATSGVTNIK